MPDSNALHLIIIVGRHQYARIFTLLRRRVESVS